MLADLNFGIQYGINYSKFYNDPNSSYLQGYSYGVQLEYVFWKHCYIASGFYYSKMGGQLKSKRIYVRKYKTLWLVDIKAQAGYIKIPFDIGYLFRINKNTFFKIFGGYSRISPVNDYTTTKTITLLQDNIVLKSNDYDYEAIGFDESVFPEGDYSHSMVDVGTGLIFKQFSIEAVAHVQIGDFGTFENISKIKKSLLSLELVLGFNLSE